ncbi:hypothetical protein [Serratia fonticola]|uniref:Uncharacterized protein n=1 Tax=Serratia fonticola TaxID=47917 RepID=A0AAW3WJM9_SERFO|nr:hypothetical protein [Serratia fonticola]MBC3211033.1 hypothetical protein [Serratia fonticola]NYA12015.1 hypothetical protein [Serratia fonticola]NYA31594.1 hypothetical protein [Serratia fonticola]
MTTTDDLYELANLEGELLVIAAYEKLDIGTQPDEDNFTDNICAVAHLAETLALKCGGGSPRYTHPSCQVLFNEVVALGRTVCPGAWDYFFGVGLEEAAAEAAGW